MLQLNNIGIRIKGSNIDNYISITLLDGAFFVLKSKDFDCTKNIVNTIRYKEYIKNSIMYYNRKKIGVFNKKKYQNDTYIFEDYISSNGDKTISEIFDLYEKKFNADLKLVALVYFSLADKSENKIADLSEQEKIFVNAAQLFFTQKDLWIINEHIGDINILDEKYYEKLIGLMAVKCDNGGIIIFMDYKNNSEKIPFGTEICIDDYIVQ